METTTLIEGHPEPSPPWGGLDPGERTDRKPMSNHHLISAAIAADAHPIDAYHRSLMEECFQTTLRDVRLHFSTASRAANEAFASLPFTVDNHICVRSAPDASFTWLLAHELTHVLQKRRAAQSRDRRSASLARLEREASAAADGILRGLPAVRLSPDPSAQPRFYGPAG